MKWEKVIWDYQRFIQNQGIMVMIMVRRYTWDNLLEPLILHLREQDWLTDLLKFTDELKQNLNLLYFRHQYYQHPAPPSPHYIESIDSNNNCVAILFFAMPS